jgi:hypothetical protein
LISFISTGNNPLTLPESLTGSGFTLSTPTELKIVVTDLNLSPGTAAIDVWVDSVSPSLTLLTPNPFCGQYFYASGSSVPISMVFGSSVPVTVSVAGTTSGTQTYSSSNVVFSQVTVAAQLDTGTNTVSARAAKPSTNYGIYAPCDVTAGNSPPPTVSWQTPVGTSRLTADGSTGTNNIPDGSAADGWQGTLKVCTDIDAAAFPAASVQFSATAGGSTTVIGSATIVADGTCPTGKTSSATLSNATVPEGQTVLLTAATSADTGSAGSASITVPVSSAAPGLPTAIGVDITDRRGVSFTPKWSAPTSGAATGYKVRVSRGAAISNQAQFDAARDIPYTGSGACPTDGCSVLVDNCYIENDYYIAVAAVDYSGNQGPILSLPKARAGFVPADLQPEYSKQRFGNVVDGTGDFNKDGLSDLLVNYNLGNEVEIYFGSKTFTAGLPNVRIQGSGAQQFGVMVAAIGDVNADKYEDFAIGSAFDGSGKVYVYYGRSKEDWDAKPILTTSDAACIISADDSFASTSSLGFAIARLGDFSGDGVDDFAVGAFGYDNYNGLAAVVLGKKQATEGGLPDSITLPTGFGTDAIRLNADANAGQFGYRLLGLGNFYTGDVARSLVVSVPRYNTNAGMLLAYRGTSSSPLATGAAAHSVAGSSAEFMGFANVVAMGNLGPLNQPAIGVTLSSSPSRVDVWSGLYASGPFAVRASYTSSTITNSRFGRAVVGGGVSGSTESYSFIGPKGGRADIAISARPSGSTPRLYLLDGDKVTMPSSVVIGTTAPEVEYLLPGTFADFSRQVTVIPDIDGDGYADLMVAETDYGSDPASGHVLVLH